MRQRLRRAKAAAEEAWQQAGHIPQDPGLREVYEQIPRAPIRLIVCPMGKSINQGGLLRLADAYRLECVDFQREPDGAIDMSGGAGVWSWQPYRWIDAVEAVREARDKGYVVCALTLAEGAITLEKVEWSFPLAIVLGSELQGIPDDVLELCHTRAAIPLFGLMTSLNVGMAAAIAVRDAMLAHSAASGFEPVRNVSRRLMGLEDASYE
jgi:tRNA G18 (ribose-2'-O)-methylase SpoU